MSVEVLRQVPTGQIVTVNFLVNDGMSLEDVASVLATAIDTHGSTIFSLEG